MVSDLIGVIGAFEYAEKHGAVAVRVYMDTVDYVDTSRGPNYWDYFFETNTYLVQSTPSNTYDEDVTDKVKGLPEVHFNGYAARFGAFGSWTQVSIGQRSSKVPFPLDNVDCGDHCGLSFFQMSRIAKKYFHLRPDIMAQVDAVWNEIPVGRYVVGAHYRGTDKRLLWPFSTPTYSKFADEIARAARNVGREADLHIFLATDEIEVVKYCVSRFGKNRVTFLSNAPRLSGKDLLGTEGGTHKSPEFTSYQKGHTAILDVWLLSKCHYVVKGRSSLSDLSLLVGGMEYRHSFYLADKLIYTKTLEYGYKSHSFS